MGLNSASMSCRHPEKLRPCSRMHKPWRLLQVIPLPQPMCLEFGSIDAVEHLSFEGEFYFESFHSSDCKSNTCKDAKQLRHVPPLTPSISREAGPLDIHRRRRHHNAWRESSDLEAHTSTLCWQSKVNSRTSLSSVCLFPKFFTFWIWWASQLSCWQQS